MTVVAKIASSITGYVQRCTYVLLALGMCSNVLASQEAGNSTSSADEPFVIGIVQFILPHPKDAILARTIDTVTKIVGKRKKVVVKSFTLQEMPDVICKAGVDIFISSSGFYRLVQHCGARDMAASVSGVFPDANHSEGAAIVTLASHPAESIDELKGTRAVTSSKEAFAGYAVPMREVALRGYDWEKFFDVRLVGNKKHVSTVLNMLKAGQTDVCFLKQCLLEEWEEQHPADKGRFKVVASRAKPGECRYSTQLYPAWVLASTRKLSPDMAREITFGVLQMPADQHGVRWGIATDFSNVDKLQEDLKVGPYAYLREWTVRRVVSEHWEYGVMLLMLLLGLVSHSSRAERLVQKRTVKLKQALEMQADLQRQAVQAASKIEALQRVAVVNQMSGIVAHEMMNPIATASLQLDLLKQMITDGKGTRGEYLELLDNVQEQTARAESIVQKVRFYRRSHARNFARIDLEESVASAVRNFEQSLIGGRQYIEAKLTPGLMIYGDALEIELMTVNLIKNAYEAVQSLEVPEVSVSLQRQGGKALLCVADNGMLRFEHDLEALTDTLGQSHKTNGLGLGLSIVRSIAERHRAELGFSIRRPHGLIVTVIFDLLGDDCAT